MRLYETTTAKRSTTAIAAREVRERLLPSNTLDYP